MIVKELETNREIEIEIGGSGDDLQIESAVYTDTGEQVDDTDWIYDAYSDSMYEDWMDTCRMRAEDAFEGDR